MISYNTNTVTMYNNLKRLVELTGLTPSTVKRIEQAHKLNLITDEQFAELMGVTE